MRIVLAAWFAVGALCLPPTADANPVSEQYWLFADPMIVRPGVMRVVGRKVLDGELYDEAEPLAVVDVSPAGQRVRARGSCGPEAAAVAAGLNRAKTTFVLCSRQVAGQDYELFLLEQSGRRLVRKGAPIEVKVVWSSSASNARHGFLGYAHFISPTLVMGARRPLGVLYQSWLEDEGANLWYRRWSRRGKPLAVAAPTSDDFRYSHLPLIEGGRLSVLSAFPPSRGSSETRFATYPVGKGERQRPVVGKKTTCSGLLFTTIIGKGRGFVAHFSIEGGQDYSVSVPRGRSIRTPHLPSPEFRICARDDGDAVIEPLGLPIPGFETEIPYVTCRGRDCLVGIYDYQRIKFKRVQRPR